MKALRIPDPFRAGHFFEITNLKSVLIHAPEKRCPICDYIRAYARRESNQTLPPVAEATGFEVIE